MSQAPHNANSGATGADKIEAHHRQQLSALIDGALAPDEARFLLRRLEHDDELSGCYERWQLCGDVLRGQVQRAADAGFSQRVAAALAAESAIEVARPAVAAAGRRHGWARWGGGGAALAASVAMVAMFVSRQQEPVLSPGAAPLVAEQQQVQQVPEAPVATPMPTAQPAAVALAAADVPAQPQPRQAAPRTATRASAARVEPARTASAASVETAQVAAASAPLIASLPVVPEAAGASSDPFASSAPLQARPWPRAVVPQASSGAFNASFGDTATAGATFYPFEPRLPAQQPLPSDLPAPPDDDAPQR